MCVCNTYTVTQGTLVLGKEITHILCDCIRFPEEHQVMINLVQKDLVPLKENGRFNANEVG